MIKKSPYEILNLSGDFEYKDIKKAYQKAIRENPPEQNPQEFAKISDAYNILTNEEYLFNSIQSDIFILDTDVKIEQKSKIDMSRYLTKIFEVPFKI